MTKKNRSKIAIIGFISIAGITIGSVSLSVVNINQSLSSKKYYYNERIFNSYAEISNYVEDNLFNSISFVENRNKWSITKNNELIYFSNPKDLRNFLTSEIKKYSGITSNINITSDEKYGLTPTTLSKIYFNNPNKKIIYRGKNNSIFKTEKEAKDSYLSIHDAYYFNGMYFRNKEDLTLYLDTEYYSDSNTSEGYDINSQKKSIAVIDKNDNYSSPINSIDLFNQNIENYEKSNNSKKEFANFISNNVDSYIEIKTNNGVKYFSKDETSSLVLKDAFLDPDYTRIYNNQGEGTYVVDLSSEDNNDLFGPYFTSSSKDIMLMKNTDAWRKISKDDPLITREYDSKQVAAFLSVILPSEITTEDKPESNFPPINIKGLNDELNRYFNELKSFNLNLYNDFINFSEIIKSGKNYNFFYYIILSHSWIINKLIQYKANEALIKNTKIIFNKIAKLIDKNIYMLIPKKLLFSTKSGQENEIISFEKILSFASNNKNFNTDIQYYIDEISYYSEFINAINIINLANLNANAVAGAIPFNYNIVNEYVSNCKTYKNDNVLNEKNYYEYEKIWNLFSSTSSQEFFENAQKINSSSLTNEEIDYLAELSVDICIVTSLFNSSYIKLFEIEKEKYSNQNINSISIPEDSIFYGLSYKMQYKILKNLNNLTFDDFILLKLIDNLLTNIHWDNEHNKLINTSNLNETMKLSKEYLEKIMNNKKLSNKFLYYGFSLLQPAKLTVSFFVNDNADTIEFLNEIKNKLPNVHDAYSSITGLFKNIQKILGDKKIEDSLKKCLESTKNLTKFFGGIAYSFVKMIPYIDLAFAILDVVSGAFIPKTDYYSYIFETNDVKYIWNGGQKRTMFWGLLPLSETTISSMKLLEPQLITSAYSNDGYYYNGKIYSDLDSLKYQELNDILSGVYQSNDLSIKIVYSFESVNTNNDVYTKRPEYILEQIGSVDNCKINNVVDGTVINYMYNKIYNEIQNGQKISYKEMFTFANGMIASDRFQSKDILIDEVINNIKPIKVVQLPNIVKGKPDYEGIEENEYQLPFNYWSLTSGVVYNNTNNKYIIYDPNIKNDETENYSISNEEIIENIKTQFYEQFEVDFKEVIEEEIKKSNYFTDLSNNVSNIDVFVANPTNQNGTAKVFLTQSQAMNYLLTEYDFTVYSTNTQVSTYKLPDKDIVFYSKDELIEWAIAAGEIKYE